MATQANSSAVDEVDEDAFGGGFDGEAATGEQGGNPDPNKVQDARDDDGDGDPGNGGAGEPGGDAGGEGGEQPGGDDPDLRQELSTLRGKYNAEVPRLHADLTAKDKRIKDLEAQLSEREEETLPEEFVALESEAPALASGVKAYVSAVLSRTLAKEITPLRDQLAELPGKLVPDTNELVARTVHFASIAARHPDHSSIVSSKAFDAYVNALPQQERDKARATIKQGSAADVIGLIGGYKKAKGLGDPFDSDVVTSRPTRAGEERTRTPVVDKNDFDAGFEGKK